MDLTFTEGVLLSVFSFFLPNKQTFEWIVGINSLTDSPLVGAEDAGSEGGHQVVGQAE